MLLREPSDARGTIEPVAYHSVATPTLRCGGTIVARPDEVPPAPHAPLAKSCAGVCCGRYEERASTATNARERAVGGRFASVLKAAVDAGEVL